MSTTNSIVVKSSLCSRTLYSGGFLTCFCDSVTTPTSCSDSLSASQSGMASPSHLWTIRSTLQRHNLATFSPTILACSSIGTGLSRVVHNKYSPSSRGGVAPHGFTLPQRWCYDQQAVERHWERLLALSRRIPNTMRGHGLPRRLA